MRTVAATLALFLCPLALHSAVAGPVRAPSRGGPVKAPSSLAKEAVVEAIFDGGIKGRWEDIGWAVRDVEIGRPARLKFDNYAGWILVRRALTGKFSALTFRVLAPPKFGNFVEVRVSAESDDSFPRIQVAEEQQHALQSGWVEVRIPMAQLNPTGAPFDRIILRAHKQVDDAWVEVDKIALMGADLSSPGAAVAPTYVAHPMSMQIDCTKATRAISPMIYGIGYSPRKDATDKYLWNLGATVRRFGGNPSSRYNWKLGNAWNTGSDWYFMNVNFTGRADYSWQTFFDDNRAHGTLSALTVPMIGHVAKDTQSYSYPVSAYGPQRARTGSTQDIGNGVRPDGSLIADTDPTRSSVTAPPEFVGDFIKAIRQYDDARRGRGVSMYFLDNEPMLWNRTHRDVHPEAVGYDELLKRTLEYAKVIRDHDPQAVIAGPSVWGWPAYFYSAIDAEAGYNKKPDRRAHEDTPLLAWYLQRLRDYETRTGERLLNVLDVHYYPQGDGIQGIRERVDAGTAERRLRATRSLWDPTYKDESWINDTVRLLPRLRTLIEENYPGLEISIGAYNFGGEKHMSGALALAEALGRFGQESVGAAYYWTYPAEFSPAYYAFRAYRNFDGQGGQFQNRSLSTTGDKEASLFASQNDAGTNIVAVVLNMNPREGADARIELVGCGDMTVGKAYQYMGGPEGIVPVTDKTTMERRTTLHQKLPPYSITVFDVKLARSRY